MAEIFIDDVQGDNVCIFIVPAATLRLTSLRFFPCFFLSCKANAIVYCILYTYFGPLSLSPSLSIYIYIYTAVAQWLRYCVTSRKVAGSIRDGVMEFFIDINPSDRTMALGSTQPLTEDEYHEYFLGVNVAGP
jgi:hypothetical protein